MIHDNEQSDRSASLMHGEERRRSQRVIIRVPVTLELTKGGKMLKVSAYTIAVNIHGAMIICPDSVDSETKVEIINDRTRERASARVTRTPRQSAEGYLIPLEFDKPFPMFWQISFPPSSVKQTEI
jgi:hypothetical protein